MPKLIDYTKSLPRHPTKHNDIRNLADIKRIVVHCTDCDWDLQKLARYDITGPNHLSKTGTPSVTYHEIIMKDGLCYHTLPYEEVSWHVGVWNPGSVGVALMLRVSDDKGKDTYGPTKEALKALVARCTALCFEFGLPPSKVVGHRELRFTGWIPGEKGRKLVKNCPGLQLDLDKLRTSITTHIQSMLFTAGYDTVEPDGIWGPLTNMAFKLHTGVR